jgi:hypothetical protein
MNENVPAVLQVVVVLKKHKNKNNAGPNPKTSIYNASVVIFYSATGSLARFENKNISSYLKKRSSLLQRWRCTCKFKKRRIGTRYVKLTDALFAAQLRNEGIGHKNFLEENQSCKIPVQYYLQSYFFDC